MSNIFRHTVYCICFGYVSDIVLNAHYEGCDLNVGINYICSVGFDNFNVYKVEAAVIKSNYT